jgi:hypothetical protein
MYKSIFKNVLSASSNFSYKYIDVGIVLGSPINSESKAIYLARTSTNINIPLNILTNSRKLNELNKNAINRLANNILETYKNYTNFNNESNKEVLIINRNSKTRQLLNVEKFIQELSFNVGIVTFDNKSLFEQIQLVRSYKYIIVACGSVQVHVYFLKKLPYLLNYANQASDIPIPQYMEIILILIHFLYVGLCYKIIFITLRLNKIITFLNI